MTVSIGIIDSIGVDHVDATQFEFAPKILRLRTLTKMLMRAYATHAYAIIDFTHDTSPTIQCLFMKQSSSTSTMVFGQRHAAAASAAKRSSPSKAVADIESSSAELTKEQEEDDDKYLKRSSRSTTRTLGLFAIALTFSFLPKGSHIVSNAKAKSVRILDDARRHNKQLKQVNKYGFKLNMNELPDDWIDWGFSRIRHKFKCDQYVDNEVKPLPTMEYWEMIRDVYNKQVDSSYTFDELVPPTQGYRFNETGGPPYHAKVSKSKDRGLFATRDINKGEVVHDGSKSDVVFPTAMAWRRFVLSLSRKAACDMTEWSWTQQLEEGGPMKILTSINISILMNMGAPDQINAVPNSSTESVFYATRDIKKGQEILTDYEIYETRFDLAGLGE